MIASLVGTKTVRSGLPSTDGYKIFYYDHSGMMKNGIKVYLNEMQIVKKFKLRDMKALFFRNNSFKY